MKKYRAGQEVPRGAKFECVYIALMGSCMDW